MQCVYTNTHFISNIIKNQVKEDGIWDQGDSRRGDKWWSDYGYLSILKIKPIYYADPLKVEC